MHEVDLIRKAIDLVDIANDYTKLKKRGNKMVGNCPFCKAKDKFTVDGKKGLFHCFGCGNGGDIFTFIMEKLNMAFPEAIEWLAKKGNLGNIQLKSLDANVKRFQEALKECLEHWLSDVMKDKQFIFKMSNIIENGPIAEEDYCPF